MKLSARAWKLIFEVLKVISTNALVLKKKWLRRNNRDCNSKLLNSRSKQQLRPYEDSKKRNKELREKLNWIDRDK
jgi:hypothetical protein